MDTAAPVQETYESQWWRALAVFRVISVLYSVGLYVRVQDEYRNPAGGWLVLTLMAAWTGFTALAYRAHARRRWPWLTADLAVAAAAILASGPLQDSEVVQGGAQTLPVIWVVAPVVAWAVVYGWLAAIPAAAVIAIANIIDRGEVTAPLLHNIVLVLLAGALVGYVTALVRSAEDRLAEAVRRETATTERDRLARVVHDGVLQVLGLVARRGRELAGEAGELGRLATRQEIALRALVTGGLLGDAEAMSHDDAPTDLRQLLADPAAVDVTVAIPATPVLLPAREARELSGAVEAILQNVGRHAGPGAKAFVLVESEVDAVVVTIRDDGRGFAPGRLERARAEGRMGVSHSVVGRLAGLGGSATYRSRPGDGVEVVLRLPRSAAAGIRHG